MYQNVGRNTALEYGEKDDRCHYCHVENDRDKYSAFLPLFLNDAKEEDCSREFDEYFRRVPDRNARNGKLSFISKCRQDGSHQNPPFQVSVLRKFLQHR